MSKITPPLKPEILSKVETDFGSTISKAAWKKLTDFQMWMNRALPVGMILSFYGSQKDITDNLIQPPNPTNWQWCDGSAITNSDSPLLGQNTPNFKEKFLRGDGTIGNLGGQVTVNIAHDHGGATQSQTDNGNTYGGEPGNDYHVGAPHTHSIASALGDITIIPPYTEVQYYIRVDGGLEYTHPTNPPSSVGTYLSEDLLKYGQIYSNDFATLLYQNCLILNSMIPLGMVVPIMTNIAGVPEPDSNMWQECDGSEIINENSPLRSIGEVRNYTPNLVEGYVKVPQSFGLSGNEAGSNTYDFDHNHGGLTNNNPDNPHDLDYDTYYFQAKIRHQHGINGNPTNINVEPPYYTVKFYIRIQ